MSFHHKPGNPAKHTVSIERDHPDKSNVGLLAVAILFTTIATLIAAFSIYLTVILQWDGPFRDLWEFIDDIERQFRGKWSLDYLIEAYGGAHRIFLPKLLFFADAYWLDGRNWLTIAVALLCQLVYLLLIVRALQQTLLSNTERLIIASVFAIALFSTTQVSNFLYAMDVQWYMSNVFGLASLYCLSKTDCLSKTGSKPYRFFWVLLWGIAAALCNFTGLMALPVAILATLLTIHTSHNTHDKVQRYSLCVFATIICLFYVSHEKNNDHIVLSALNRSDDWKASLHLVFSTLQQMLPYMLRYLASPLSRDWPVIGSVLSIAGITISLYYWIRFPRKTAPLSNWQTLCLCISTYIVASAFFTAFGRIIYPNSATAERYQTLVLPWLPALFGLLWPDLRKSRYATVLLLLCLAIYSYSIFPAQPVSAKNMVILSQRVNLAHTAARASVLEPPHILATLSYPLIKNSVNSVKDNDSFLRSHRLGYFQHLPGFSLEQTLQIPEGLPDCAASTNLQHDSETRSLVIDGQALADNTAVSDVILLQGNTVVGLGTAIGSDDSLLPTTWQPATASRFRAFASTQYIDRQKPLILLGILNEQPVCRYSIPAY